MAKAISIAKIFEHVKYAPHKVQVLVHRSVLDYGARFRVVCAGRRTGKSTLGGHELTGEAVRAYYRTDIDPYDHRAEFWIVGPEYSDAEKEFRVLWSDLQKLGMEKHFDHPGTYYSPESGNMHLSMYGGKFQVHCKSAKYPNSLVGEALEGVILAEAAKLKPSVWHKYIRPMLADYRGWALFTSTPEGRNWFYDLYRFGQDPAYKDWWSVRMPSWANNILFPLGREDPEIASMSAGMSAEKFKQEIGADFTEFVGRVFKDFDEELHVGDYTYNPEWPVYAALDYGWTNPFVWLLIQIDPLDNVYIIGEHYQSNLTTEENIWEVQKKGLCPPKLRYIYPDPAGPSDTAVVERMLRVKGMGGTGGPIQDRLELIRRWLKLQPDDRPGNDSGYLAPKLTVDRSCVNFIREFSEYRYPDGDTDKRDPNENPMKKDDHTPEALGRFFIAYYGTRARSGEFSRHGGFAIKSTQARVTGRKPRGTLTRAR
jgi:hypothetical protein